MLLRRRGIKKILGEYSKLSDDTVLYSIFPFLSSKFLIRICSVVSKKWNDWIHSYIPLSLECININDQELIDNFAKYSKKGYLNRLIYLELSSGLSGECFLGDLSNLKELIIKAPIQFTDEQVKGLTQLVKLEVLDINGCQFPSNNGGLAFLLELKDNLTELRCPSCPSMQGDDEDQQVVIRNIEKLPKLKYLSLNVRSKQELDLELLTGLNGLRSLAMEKAFFEDVDAKLISRMNNLTELNLDTGDISCEGCEPLSKMIELKSLNISRNSIGNLGCYYLSRLQKLTNLKIDECSVSGSGINYLTNLSHLEYLSMNKTLDRERDTVVMEFSNFENLTKLRVSETRLTDKDFKELSRSRKLKILDFSSNVLSRDEASYISQIKSCTELDLSRTERTIDGVGWDYLATMSNLKKLFLHNKCIGLDGIKYMKLHGYVN